MTSLVSGGVLVVDDDPDVRGCIAFALRVEGYRVREASNGVDALTQLEEEPACLILLDLMMPHMNGWEFLTEWNARRESQEAVVVLCTACPRHASLPTVGVDGVLWKPFDAADLLDLVRRYCTRKLSSRSAA